MQVQKLAGLLVLTMLHACASYQTVKMSDPTSMTSLNSTIAGDHLSVKLQDGEKFNSKNLFLTPDSAIWQDPKSGDLHWVETSKVKSISRYQHGMGAAQGLGIGFLVGATVGATIGLEAGDDPVDEYYDEPLIFTAQSKAVIAGAALGVAGGVLGTIVGAIGGNPDVYYLEHDRPKYVHGNVRHIAPHADKAGMQKPGKPVAPSNNPPDTMVRRPAPSAVPNHTDSYKAQQARQRRNFWRKAKWISLLATAGLTASSFVNESRGEEVYDRYLLAETPEHAEFWRQQSQDFDQRTRELRIAAGVCAGTFLISHFIEQGIHLPQGRFSLGYDAYQNAVSLQVKF